jgi:hypothetical protein
MKKKALLLSVAVLPFASAFVMRARLGFVDPRARVDTRVLEVLCELDGSVSLPLGLRMDLHLPPSQPGELR